MSCPSKLCPAEARDGCHLTVCAFDLPQFRRFQFLGGFSVLERLAAPTPKRRGPRRTAAHQLRGEEWRRLYTEEYLTLDEIGEQFGVTRERVRQVLREWPDLDLRAVAKERTRRQRLAKASPCLNCDGPVLRVARTCSEACAEAWRTSPRRFWQRVDKSAGPLGCWLWTGPLNADTGYAHLRWGGRNEYAHRIAYALEIGPIPAGLSIDHVWDRGCRHRHCVNPAHLEAVTLRENILRSPFAQAAINARKTHCKDGHRYETGPATCAGCVAARRSRGLQPSSNQPCQATNANGLACGRSAAPASDVCHIHADDWADKLRLAVAQKVAS